MPGVYASWEPTKFDPVSTSHLVRDRVSGARYSRVSSVSASASPTNVSVLPSKRQLPADPVGDVRQVRQRRRQVALLDVAGEHLRVVRADGVDEVRVVRRLLAREHVRVAAALLRRGLGARALLVLAAEVATATCGRRRRSRPSPWCRRRGCRSAGCPRRWCSRRGCRTRGSCRRRTRRSWCACPASPARPAGRSSRRSSDTLHRVLVLVEAPARDVELVRALVAGVAVAVVPVPVPVVVEAVAVERVASAPGRATGRSPPSAR